MFFLLTGASREWGVSFESFSGSIHKHQFHYKPVRWAWDREDEKDEMKEEKCSDEDVRVDTLCASVWGFYPPLPLFPSPRFSLWSIFSAPALWTGGCLRLQYPVRSHYSHCGGRKGQMRDGKTKRQTERARKVYKWGDERRMGHCAEVHHYTSFQETDQEWLEPNMNPI